MNGRSGKFYSTPCFFNSSRMILAASAGLILIRDPDSAIAPSSVPSGVDNHRQMGYRSRFRSLGSSVGIDATLEYAILARDSAGNSATEEGAFVVMVPFRSEEHTSEL